MDAVAAIALVLLALCLALSISAAHFFLSWRAAHEAVEAINHDWRVLRVEKRAKVRRLHEVIDALERRNTALRAELGRQQNANREKRAWIREVHLTGRWLRSRCADPCPVPLNAERRA